MSTLFERIPEDIKARLSERTLALAKGTREPRHAYVALQVPKVRHIKDSAPEVTTGIATLNVEDQPGQRHIIQNMLLKQNAVVLAFGNFPTHNDVQPERAAKYGHHNVPNQQNPWDSLASLCGEAMGQVKIIAENERRFKMELEAKYKEQLDAKEKELEQLRSKTNGDQSGKNGMGEKQGSTSKRSSKGDEATA